MQFINMAYVERGRGIIIHILICWYGQCHLKGQKKSGEEVRFLPEYHLMYLILKHVTLNTQVIKDFDYHTFLNLNSNFKKYCN